MISLEVHDAERILVIELKGLLSEADIDEAIETLQARYPAVGVHLRGGDRGGFSVLLDWRDLEGWQMGAKTLATITARTIGDAVRKVAIVADARFADEQQRVADIAPAADVRLFPATARDDAMAWLRAR
jgi:hypothetical protein